MLTNMFPTTKNTLSIVQKLVIKDLQMAETDIEFVQNTEAWEELHCKLSFVIRHLLQHDFERLLQAMYRIDVSEIKFREAMQNPDLNSVANQITDLVLQRESEKAYFRELYQS